MNNHLSKLRALLIDQKLDAMLISGPANLYYTSGFICLSPSEREAYVIVTKQHAYLITSPLYAGDTKLLSSITLAQTDSNYSHEERVIDILAREHAKRVGFEEHFLSVAQFNDLETEHVQYLPAHVRNLRVQKDSEEIDRIAKACAIGDAAFRSVLQKIKPGISEKELALELELFIRKKGATISFPTIIGFGKNAAIPHHVTSTERLQNNAFVLMDFGVTVDQYCSDMTRTVYVGEPSDEEKKMYETVRSAQEKAIGYIIRHCENPELAEGGEAIPALPAGRSLGLPRSLTVARNDIHASEVDKIARDYIQSQSYPDFPHTLGHGIGLEVHEAPSLSTHSKDTLVPGMVFSVEPGIYLKGKTGIRIEDLMVIDENGARILTNAPKELMIL